MSIADNLKRVQDEIADACARAGRKPSEITLVAVSKTVEPERIVEAIRAGVTDLGENWVQEATAKKPAVLSLCGVSGDGLVVPSDQREATPSFLGDVSANCPARWHMIGHLQSNKAKKVLEIFDVFQGIDSVHLLKELDKRSAQQNRVFPVMIEVNTSGEASKFGVPPDELPQLVSEMTGSKSLRLVGLMTIGPGLSVEDPEKSRPCFRLLRELRAKIEREHNVQLPFLSMGMSSDFAVAIQEGSTMLRIGTAIFGSRQ
jgi:PLP dependent protein